MHFGVVERKLLRASGRQILLLSLILSIVPACMAADSPETEVTAPNPSKEAKKSERKSREPVKKKWQNEGYYGNLNSADTSVKPEKSNDDGYYGSLKKSPPAASAAPAASAPAASAPLASPSPEIKTGAPSAETSSSPTEPLKTSPAEPKAAGSIDSSHPGTQVNTAAAQTSNQSSQRKLFLWKGTRGNQTLYLLGTIHVLRDSFYPLPADIDRALGESKTLFIEAISPDVKTSEEVRQLQKSRGTYPAGDKLSKHLSPETTQQLRDYLKWAGESLEMYEEDKPWLAEALISSAALRRNGFKAAQGIDIYLANQARSSKTPIRGLETPQSQVELLSGFPDEVQDRMLRLSIKRLSELPQFVNDATLAWRSGDLQKMEQIVQNEAQLTPDTLAAHKKVVEVRNASMCAALDKAIVSDGTVFAAVGAAHIVGDTGLITLLEGKGFKFEQVTQTPAFTAGGIGKLRRLSYPEGHFSISLPGVPEMACRQVPMGQTGLNMRAVLYQYEEHAGNYLVGYIIFPNQVNLGNPAVAQSVMTAMASTFTTAPQVKKGSSNKAQSFKVLKAYSTTMLGYPAREVLSVAKNGDSELDSCLRMFVAGQYLYVVIAEGTKAWQKSPAVSSFLSSIQINNGRAATTGFAGGRTTSSPSTGSLFTGTSTATRPNFKTNMNSGMPALRNTFAVPGTPEWDRKMKESRLRSESLFKQRSH